MLSLMISDFFFNDCKGKKNYIWIGFLKNVQTWSHIYFFENIRIGYYALMYLLIFGLNW